MRQPTVAKCAKCGEISHCFYLEGNILLSQVNSGYYCSKCYEEQCKLRKERSRRIIFLCVPIAFLLAIIALVYYYCLSK